MPASPGFADNVPYVWSPTMLGVRKRLIARNGAALGHALALQLVIDAMKFAPADDAGHLEARDAMLSADVALTGGDNRCQIWRGFADRGMGINANYADGVNPLVESYEIPGPCRCGLLGIEPFAVLPIARFAARARRRRS